MSRLMRSFSFAIQGIIYTIASEPNMKIHFAAAAAAITMAAVFGISRVEWGLLCLTIFMVLIAESINTALERAVDLSNPETHPLAKAAKDAAAGGVLLAALSSIFMAVIIFGPYIIKLCK